MVTPCATLRGARGYSATAPRRLTRHHRGPCTNNVGDDSAILPPCWYAPRRRRLSLNGNICRSCFILSLLHSNPLNDCCAADTSFMHKYLHILFIYAVYWLFSEKKSIFYLVN